MDLVVANRFRVGQMIGKGAFGDIYMGEEIEKSVHVARE